MKLHLPKGLRAALLAVVTAGAAFTTTVQAANSPCTYGNKTHYLDENWALYDNDGAIDTELTQIKGASDTISILSMSDVNKQSWTLILDAYNITPIVTDGVAEEAYLFGTAQPAYDPETGAVTLGTADAFSIFVTRTGQVRLATTQDSTEVMRNSLILGYLDRNWEEDVTDAPFSMRLVLEWNDKGGLPRGNEGGKYGSLTLRAIKLLSNEDDHSILGDLESNWIGKAVTENCDLPAHLFGGPTANATTSVGSGQVKFSLFHYGLERTDKWVPNSTWLVSGETSINSLVNGQYYCGISKENRELGNLTYENPQNPTQSVIIADTITFTGSHGALKLTEAIPVDPIPDPANPNPQINAMAQLDQAAVKDHYKMYTLVEHETENDGEYKRNPNEFQLSNKYEIGYEISPTSSDLQVIAGFGAAEGLTLRVDLDVLETTVLSEGACGLSIVGTGTTILEIDNTGMKRLGHVEGTFVHEDIAFNGSIGELQAKLAELEIDTAGMREQQVWKGNDNNFCFVIKDTDPNRYLTFASTEASNIVLSPKGNGRIHLNLHTSNLHEQSRITMVDETVQVKEEVTPDVPLMGIRYEWEEDDSGKPVYTNDGKLVYADPEYVKVEGEDNVFVEVPKIRYERDPDNGGAYVALPAGSPDTVTYKAYVMEMKDDGTYVPARDDEGRYITREITIKLTNKPAEVHLFEPRIGDDGYVVKENGSAVTKLLYTKGETQTLDVWRSWNEHAAIEKTVNDTYDTKNSLVYADYSITGTPMEINLFSDAVDQYSATGGYFENAIEHGTIAIRGRKAIMGKTATGATAQVGGIMSKLTAAGIKAKGSITIDSNLDLKEDLHSDNGILIQSGTTNARNVTSKLSLNVGSVDDVLSDGDPHTATLIVRDTLSVEASEGFAPNISIYGGAAVNHLKTDNVVYVGINSTGALQTPDKWLNVTPEAWLSVGTADAPEIRTPWISIHGNTLAGAGDFTTYARQELLSGLTHFYYDKKATVAGSDFHQTVLGGHPASYTQRRIMESASVAGNTTIELLTNDVLLRIHEMDGSNIYLGNSSEVGITPLALNLAHKPNADTDKVIIDYSSTIASGSLSATEFIMPENYLLSAAELTVTNTLKATATTSDAATAAQARTATTPDTVYQGNVYMKNAVVTAGYTSASEIKADSIVLGTGHVLSGATVSTSRGLVAGDGTTLRNITLAAGDLTTLNDVTIYNMSMSGGSFKTEGDVDFHNMSLANMLKFGGSDGGAFTPVGGDAAKMTFNGSLTKTGDDTFTLSLVNVAIDARGHDFSEDSEVEIIEANGGNAISVTGIKSVSYEVQPYTYADYKIDGGVLYLVGDKNEAKAKAELIGGSEVRKETMSAIDEALKATPGGELAALHDAMGMVMKASTESRREILDSISGASLTALADSQRRGVQNVQNSLRNRIIQMGGNADWENAGIQAWAQADGGFSTTKSSDDAPGYDYTAWGATVGANIDLAETVTAGMSFSASYGEIESDHADKATGDSNAYYVNLFARHQTGRWTQMLILTAGQNDMTLERTVGSHTAEGDTSGSTFSAYYEVGYTLGLNNEFTHILQPIVSARITSAKVDGYEEKGSIGNAALSYDGGSYTYGTIAAGFRYQGVMYESVFERNAVLELRAMVTSDFGDTTDTAKVALGQGKMREVKGVDTSGTGFDLGVGLSIPMEMQTTLFFDADLNMRPDYTGVSANVGLRYDF